MQINRAVIPKSRFQILAYRDVMLKSSFWYLLHYPAFKLEIKWLFERFHHHVDSSYKKNCK